MGGLGAQAGDGGRGSGEGRRLLHQAGVEEGVLLRRAAGRLQEACTGLDFLRWIYL